MHSILSRNPSRPLWLLQVDANYTHVQGRWEVVGAPGQLNQILQPDLSSIHAAPLGHEPSSESGHALEAGDQHAELAALPLPEQQAALEPGSTACKLPECGKKRKRRKKEAVDTEAQVGKLIAIIL